MRIEALRLDHVEKSIGGERMLSDINLCFFAEGIHAVLMQNTNQRRALIDILSGITLQDRGDIYLFDQAYAARSTYQAKKSGVFVIGHQSHLVPGLNIAENLFLTDDRYVRFGFTNTRQQNMAAEALLIKGRLNHIAPKQLAGTLPTHEAHMVETLRALSLDAKVIIFENVMERYSDTEMQQVLRFLAMLKEQGLCIILFSNKYNAPFDVADYASIVHGGVTVALYSKGEITRDTLLRHLNAQPYHRTPLAYPIPKVSALRLDGIKLPTLPEPVNWSVPAGEIIGIWDQEFIHSPALVDALFGKGSFSGSIWLDGKLLRRDSYKTVLQQGLILIPERSQSNYIFPNMGLEENLTLMMRAPLYRWGIRSERMQNFASHHALAVLQSGQLQEKVGDMKILPSMRRHEQMQIVVAKWLCCKPKAFVFINPFFSYDDVTMYEFQEMLDHLRKERIAVVVFSMNLREIRLVADRIFHFQSSLVELD